MIKMDPFQQVMLLVHEEISLSLYFSLFSPGNYAVYEAGHYDTVVLPQCDYH